MLTTVVQLIEHQRNSSKIRYMNNLGRSISGVLAWLPPMAVIGCGLLHVAGHAQSSNSAEVQQQVDEAFRAVLSSVDSKEARLKYSSLLVQSGNYEGGIAALEGLLLLPDAPASLRVELAVLYYRLGSYAIAEAYLRKALDDPRLDATLKKQAEVMLDDVVRRNRQNLLTGSLMVGLRGQTNPAAAPGPNAIFSQGVLVQRPSTSMPKSDVDAQVWLKLNHTYDLEMQNEAAVVTNLVGFVNHYSSVDSYSYAEPYTGLFDVTVLAGTTGLRFRAGTEGKRPMTLQSYGIYGEMLLNGSRYFSTGGTGVSADYKVNDRCSWGTVFEFRHYNFAARDDINQSAAYSGNENLLKVHASAEIGPNKVLVGEASYVNRSAQQSYFGFKGPQATLSYVFTYAGPGRFSDRNWTTTFSGTAFQHSYHAADPSVDMTIVRRDSVQRVSLTNVVPFSRSTNLQVQAEYTRSVSNIPNYSFSNLALTVGVLSNF